MTEAVAVDTSAPLVRRWQAPTIEITWIHAELARLWVEWDERLAQERKERGAAPPSQAYMRPSTLNLIAVATTEEEAFELESIMTQLPDYSPSRGLILIRGGMPGGSSNFSVRIAVQERRASRSRVPVRLETVMIGAAPGNDVILSSITAPLLVPDLADVLFVRSGPLTPNPLVESLVQRIDNLLVDSARLPQVGTSLSHLTTLAQSAAKPQVADVAWIRLATWRQLVSQFFDQPMALPCLDSIDEATIICDGKSDDGVSGLTAGLLMAGWLGSRLGWRTPGELVRSKEGWRLTLRAGQRGRSREVLLRLLQGTSDFSCASLEAVHLSAAHGHPGSFSVIRTADDGITTSSETPTIPRVSRLVQSSCPDDRSLLSQSLRLLHEDRIYIDALTFAAELWPEGMDG
jgi:glucose-6-phosphate dehydrogenase assembly protein OpcA